MSLWICFCVIKKLPNSELVTRSSSKERSFWKISYKSTGNICGGGITLIKVLAWNYNLVRKMISMLDNKLRIHWKLSTTLKKAKKFTSYKINGIKNALFFFREQQLIIVLLLISDFNMSWSANFVSLKLCVGFSICDFVPFLLKFTFFFIKMHGLFDFNTS